MYNINALKSIDNEQKKKLSEMKIVNLYSSKYKKKNKQIFVQFCFETNKVHDINALKIYS